ncbi:transporter substrate-binding domain-containing protein [Roseibium denhamense]|uniref:Amino acid ABC transporter substrate-binding protein, PAAT family n=1 Tax=Roseibium denhamense TaxID=76305 RepID=A0ABY1NE69_9HYPH|nr:transporter substrate-binding domain-containing protein [Roseibium denhamense]MTI04311.1 transporter substrate-binding domain-containing protein [Roseibium denhamense]SMP07090.1 amino acid ABC transporter substrate-binding protein, PAAT family [Roseibium denhamense]
MALAGVSPHAAETTDRLRWFAQAAATVFATLALAAQIVLTLPAHAAEMRLITSPWPPSNFLDDNGNPTGLSVEVVEALKTRVGVTTPIEVLPWARGYLAAQSDPNVMLFTAGRTDERLEMGFQFIAPIVMWNHVLLGKTGQPIAAKTLDEVRDQGLTVAGVRGSWQIELVKAAGIEVVETEDQDTCARMLMANRVDLWITSHLQGTVVLQDNGFKAEDVVPWTTIRKSPSYLMVSKGTDPELIDAWRKAYEELLLTDFFDQVAKKWSGTLGMPLGFEPGTGFYAVSIVEPDPGS